MDCQSNSLVDPSTSPALLRVSTDKGVEAVTRRAVDLGLVVLAGVLVETVSSARVSADQAIRRGWRWMSRSEPEPSPRPDRIGHHYCRSDEHYPDHN